MITYLVIANGDSNKSYKCNTTHTSKPYIRINEHNYLDLTTETTTGVQLKYKQKTGSSYKTYNTTVDDGYMTNDTITSYFASGTASSYRIISFNKTMSAHATSGGKSYTISGLDTKYTTYTESNSLTNYDTNDSQSYTYSNYFSYTENLSSWGSTTRVAPTYITSTYLTTTKSVETFKNRVYIPVQSQSTTVSTTRSSLYTNTTGYTGRSTYNTTTYKTTGYIGASWWSENHVSTTGYSAYSTSARTTGTGYRSTTSSRNSTSYATTGTWNGTIFYYGVNYSSTRKNTWYWSHKEKATSKWFFQNGGSNSSTTYLTRVTNDSVTDTWSGTGFVEWILATGYYSSDYRRSTNQTKSQNQGTYSYTQTSSWPASGNYPQQTGYFTHYEYDKYFSCNQYGTTDRGNSPGWNKSYTMSWNHDPNPGNQAVTGVSTDWDISFRTGACTRNSGTYSYSVTSRYSTTDYKDWYPDFTAYSTGTSRYYNYWTSTARPSNYNGITELTSGYTTRNSSLASSTAAGALSSTTALTSSGTRTSSSLKYSSKPGALVSITELTITSTRTSLTNRTSSTDL